MRKFNIDIFKEYLNEEIRGRTMKRDTANDYVRKLQTLNDSLPDDFDCKALAERIDYLSRLSGGTQARKYINAVKKYEKGVIQSPGVCLYGSPLSALYQKYKPRGVVEIRHEEETYRRKINGLSNQAMKMKLALRLQMKSGLRISEIAKLRKEDLTFKEGTLYVRVIGGKGNKNRVVTALKDDWLEKNLKQYLFSCTTDRVFDSARAIETFAKGMDIKTHELRKVYARKLYRQLRRNGSTMAQARKEVGLQLGHDGTKAGRITNLYLGKEWEYGRAKKVQKKE